MDETKPTNPATPNAPGTRVIITPIKLNSLGIIVPNSRIEIIDSAKRGAALMTVMMEKTFHKILVVCGVFKSEEVISCMFNYPDDYLKSYRTTNKLSFKLY
jgi:hypothetical protein